MKTQHVMLVAACLLTLSSNAQQMILSECIGTTENEYAHDIVPTSDGGMIIAGYTKTPPGVISSTNHGGKDYLIAKLNADGTLSWMKNFGGSMNDEAWGVAEVGGGEYLIIGSSYSDDGDITDHIGSTEFADMWVLKLNDDGNIIWQISYGTEGDDTGADVAYNSNHRIIIGGTVSEVGQNVSEIVGGSDYWIAELDNNGNIQWESVYGGIGNEKMQELVCLPNNDMYLGGTSYSFGSSAFDGESYIIKVNQDGDQLWDLNVGSTSDNGIGSIGKICLNEEGGILLSYQSSLLSDGLNCDAHGSFLFAEISADGELLSNWCFGGDGVDKSTAMCADNDGMKWMVGTTNSNSGDVNPPTGYEDNESNIWLAKCDENGDLLWNQSIGGPEMESAVSMFMNSNGKIYLIGNTNSSTEEVVGQHDNSSGTFDIWFVIVDTQVSSVGSSYLENQLCTVYPNPTNDLLNIAFTQTSPWAIAEVYNMHGEMMQSSKINTSNHQMDLSQWSAGCYQLNIKSIGGELIASKRFIKK
jgi:hypothetical protein